MQKIIFATGNEGKMREIRQILGDMPLEILSLKEAGLDPEIHEDASSFAGNALIKARTVHALPEGSQAIVLADDSGLEVDWLNGEPGIYSARYLGESVPYSIKNQSILDRLQGVTGEARSARFRCAVAAVFPDGQEAVSEGTIEGQIAGEILGDGGFGYDPIFWLPGEGLTTAQLPAEKKNAISHRGKALRGIRPVIEQWLAGRAV